jgi:RHS repeat-associated protein
VRLGYRGELCIGHLVWLGARPYDPATRSFLAPDPLPNPPGAPCAANPYHYAWNDPVSLVDPSGLRPLTQDEFNQRKHAEELGHLGAAWEAIKKDPWGSVALGLTVAAGVGLLFVPGGQAIGAGILIGVAISSGAGIATGTFDPRMAALNGGIGALTGGLGSALSGASVATQVVAGAGMGAGSNLIVQGVQGGPIDWWSVGLSAGIGGVAGGVGAKIAAAREANAGAKGGWTLPEGGGGAKISGRWYTEHALERMAPDTPQVRAELEARALVRAEAAGLKPGTSAFGEWWRSYGPDPRGVPPMVVEGEIANPGSTNVRVITGPDGRVITVIPR